MRRRELLSLAFGLGTIESAFAVSVDSEPVSGCGSSRTDLAACFTDCGLFEECGSCWCDEGEQEWCDEGEQEWCDEGEQEWCDEGELPESFLCRSFERLDAECATGQTGIAKIHTADECLRLRGVIEAPTPCYDVDLEAVDEDEDEDEVVIVVAATDPLDGFCVQCLGAIRYEVRLAFEVNPPESVEILHRTMGETRRIEPRSATDPR